MSNGYPGVAGPWAGLGHRRWSARFVGWFTLGGGVGSAVIAVLGLMASWGGCQDELEGGGSFSIGLLGIAAVVVLPLVALASAGLASGVNSLLLRSVRLRKLSDIVPALITAAGAAALITLIIIWIAVGNPPPGYCDPAPG